MLKCDFDPNGTGQDNGNYFGLPFSPEESALVLLSVPWDVTASYGEGAGYGPDAIIGASTQLDLYDPLNPHFWRKGIGTIGIDYGIQEKSAFLRTEAVKVMKHLEKGGKVNDDYAFRRTSVINKASQELNEYVYGKSIEWLSKGKIVGIVGGDHSAPYGLVKALSERHDGLSVLHIDAHADLREAYEGFEFSHASIMYNIATRLPIRKLVQVGIRDYCDAEAAMAAANPLIELIGDHELAANRFRGMNWDEQCERIISHLGKEVYISFDIDGLSPDNAPHTGTPVPGGLSFNEAVYLLRKVVEAGKRVVGFDICEVSPRADDQWDANVGARILYKLCSSALSE